MQGEIKLQVASCELKCKIQEVGCKCKEQDEDKVSGYEIRRQVTSYGLRKMQNKRIGAGKNILPIAQSASYPVNQLKKQSSSQDSH